MQSFTLERIILCSYMEGSPPYNTYTPILIRSYKHVNILKKSKNAKYYKTIWNPKKLFLDDSSTAHTKRQNTFPNRHTHWIFNTTISTNQRAHYSQHTYTNLMSVVTEISLPQSTEYFTLFRYASDTQLASFHAQSILAITLNIVCMYIYQFLVEISSSHHKIFRLPIL